MESDNNISPNIRTLQEWRNERVSASRYIRSCKLWVHSSSWQLQEHLKPCSRHVVCPSPRQMMELQEHRRKRRAVECLFGVFLTKLRFVVFQPYSPRHFGRLNSLSSRNYRFVVQSHCWNDTRSSELPAQHCSPPSRRTPDKMLGAEAEGLSSSPIYRQIRKGNYRHTALLDTPSWMLE